MVIFEGRFSGWISSRRMISGESKLLEVYFTDGKYVVTVKIVVVYSFIRRSFNEKTRLSIIKMFRKYSVSIFLFSKEDILEFENIL